MSDERKMTEKELLESIISFRDGIGVSKDLSKSIDLARDLCAINSENIPLLCSLLRRRCKTQDLMEYVELLKTYSESFPRLKL